MPSASAPEMLITGGDDGSRRAITMLLERQGYSVEEAPSMQLALSRLSEHAIPLALVDARAGGDSAELIRRIRRSSPGTETIVLAEGGSADAAERSLSAGARGYFCRPIRDWQRFHDAIDECIAASVASPVEIIKLRPARRHGALARLKGNAPPIRKLVERLKRLARLPDPLLIRGESGVGKELVARAIHEQSPQAEAPFVAVNCAAIKPELFESALFGHSAGAFTGAMRERAGLIEAAREGTLFLDEVGELSPELQAKLLRLIEQREYRRVGEETLRALEARVLAATHVDLEEAIEAGRFRKDLYFRLSAFELHVPALRERREDIELLAYHFLHLYNQRYERQIARISPDVMRRLEATAWRRNNVRELEWCIRQAVALSDDGEELKMSAFDGRLPVLEAGEGEAESEASEPQAEGASISTLGLRELRYKDALSEMRRRFAGWYATRCLVEADYNQAYAAELAGMKRPNFLRLLRDLDIDASPPPIVVNSA
jgi:DNA-binding NtrC family response regulator